MQIQNAEQIRKAFSCLDDLAGLEQVKNTLMNACIRAAASGEGMPGRFVFSGNPGTGKTVVAHKLGEILKQAGILKSGHVVACRKADLVSSYIGQSAMQTRAMCEKALDGVLLVEEAYTLVNTEPCGNKFNSCIEEEAYTELMSCMERYKDRVCFVFEGYPEVMGRFMNANPGMRARMTEVVEFPDYTVDELVRILALMAKKKGFSFGPRFEEIARKVFADRKADPVRFGNAREAAMFLGRCQEGAAERYLRTRNEDLKYTLTVDDISEDLYPRFSEEAFRTAMAELNDMIGLENVKKTLQRRLQAMRLFEDRVGPGHYVFAGNPGTGKTEVARKLGAIFKAMGVLCSGHVVKVSRSDLISAYVGGTALQTRAKCEEALDGILFVEEAHTLCSGGSAFDFGREALDTIAQFMEDNRNRVCVIFAGNEEGMRKLLESNDGFASRITEIIPFPDSAEKSPAMSERIPSASVRNLAPLYGEDVLGSMLKLAVVTDSAVLFLQTDKGCGTAFLISPEGYALTCNHLISGAARIEARLRVPAGMAGTDSWHKCEVVNTSEKPDLALIKLEGENFPYLPLAPEDRVIRKGEEFILSGYPFGRRTEKYLTTFRGYVASSEKQTDDNGFARYYIGGEAKSGSAGSPLISLEDGRVIGIHLGTMTENAGGALTEEISYMRPIRYFWEKFTD